MQQSKSENIFYRNNYATYPGLDRAHRRERSMPPAWPGATRVLARPRKGGDERGQLR